MLESIFEKTGLSTLGIGTECSPAQMGMHFVRAYGTTSNIPAATLIACIPCARQTAKKAAIRLGKLRHRYLSTHHY